MSEHRRPKPAPSSSNATSPHPPEKLWRALTQPHLIEEWLMKNDFKPVVGHRFNLRGDWGGVLDCEVLVVEPQQDAVLHLEFRARRCGLQSEERGDVHADADGHGNAPAHGAAGFRPDQRQAFGGANAGWQQFFAKLEQVLARELNAASAAASAPEVAAMASEGAEPRTAKSQEARPPSSLSGGNPQIAKGYGDAPVQAYIAAMPGWKRDVGRRLDALIARAVPGVHKAVKWNSPFYGVEGEGWFLSFHCFTKYVKVAFFRGASLRPVPPGESKQKDVRYLDIHEDDQLDEAQFAAWVKQASQLPGERM